MKLCASKPTDDFLTIYEYNKGITMLRIESLDAFNIAITGSFLLYLHFNRNLASMVIPKYLALISGHNCTTDN